MIKRCIYLLPLTRQSLFVPEIPSSMRTMGFQLLSEKASYLIVLLKLDNVCTFDNAIFM